MTAVVIATNHATSEQEVYGPFSTGDVASRFGFKTFPNNTNRAGQSVTWCWVDLIHPKSPYAMGKEIAS
jgi:hypothetical protein